MCRIALLKSAYNGSMSNGGTSTHVELNDFTGMTLVHEWLPIQTTGEGSPIIRVGDISILFNGEIFNHEEESDLKLIEKIVEAEGISGLIHFLYSGAADGFWSIIIHSPFETLAMTDPLGKKQLYYKEGVGIASEIRALRDSCEVDDGKHLANTIKFGYCFDNSTPWKNIKRLMPNRIYSFRSLKAVKATDAQYDFFEPEALPQDLYSLMEEATLNRMARQPDVSIALLLSGGLDSSIIAHHLRNSNVQSYCVDNKLDIEFAEMVDPNVKVIETKPDDLERAIHIMEYPLDLGSVAPQLALAESVSETIMVTGDGADELFGGYRRASVYDSQLSDVFCELPFYHHIRLDRMAAYTTKEIRSPFLNLNVVKYALDLGWSKRRDKNHLRQIYEDYLPQDIIVRAKEPLKTTAVRAEDPILYRQKLLNIFRGKIDVKKFNI